MEHTQKIETDELKIHTCACSNFEQFTITDKLTKNIYITNYEGIIRAMIKETNKK